MYPTATTPRAPSEGAGPAPLERSREHMGRSESAPPPGEAPLPGDLGNAWHVPPSRLGRAFERSLIRDDNTLASELRDRHMLVRPSSIEALPNARSEPDASQHARVESTPTAEKRGVEALPVQLQPRTESRGGDTGRPADRPSTVTMPAVVPPRRDRVPAPETDVSPGRVRALDREGRRIGIVLMPPPTRVSPTPSAPAEIVIGRISVVVESARPPAPAPRPPSRPAAPASSRPADDGLQIARRFGIGQL